MTTLAFAGAGMITVVHGLAAEASPGVEVVAVASRTPERASERANQVRARACTYDELPAGAEFVLVATPPALHARDAQQALAAGASVIVEKPLCTTLADADALVAADPDGTRIGYAENLAFAPVVDAALARVHAIGELEHLEARSLQNPPEWGDFLTAGWGGGVFFDLGVHPLALVLLAAAPATPVSVRGALESSDGLEVDDWAEVHITFDTGLTARIEASWRDETPAWDLQAASASGVVRLELLPYLQLEANGDPVEVAGAPEDSPVPQAHDFGYVKQLQHFLACRAAGQPMTLGAAFGRQVLDIVCAAYSSAGADGVEVPLPFAGPRDRTPLQLWRS